MAGGLVELHRCGSIVLFRCGTSYVPIPTVFGRQKPQPQAECLAPYDTEFRLRLSLSKSLHIEAVDSELWATCFTADVLLQHKSCFTCGSLSHFAAACPSRRKFTSSLSGRFQGTNNQHGTSGWSEPQPHQDDPARQGIQARLGAKPEFCGLYNDKGTCFRGYKCPYSHHCRHCGGPHPECGCPKSHI